MLVLSRKRDQSIMIGDDIEIVIVDIKGEQVKIGIRAPRDVVIHRKEVYEEIQRENRLAANTSIKNIDDLFNIIDKGNKKIK